MPTDTNIPICLTRTQPNEVADTAQRHQTLIVLIPPDLDTSLLSRQIWRLVNATNMHVLLLGVGGDDATEPSLRRGMVTLTAMLRGGRIPTDMRIETNRNWVDIVESHYCPGDMIVCPAGYRIGLFHKPFRQILEEKLNAPTYVLSMSNVRKETPVWRSELMAWSGFVGLLSGFGLLQLGIIRSTSGGFQTILLVLSTILEFWLFGVWNNLTR